MRNLKFKIISAALAVFSLGIYFGGTLAMSADEEYQTIVIRPENFMLSEGSGAVIDGTQWGVTGINAIDSSEHKYTLNNNASADGVDAEATIPIYITNDDAYRMFVLMRDLNDNNQTRLFSAGIDEQYEYFGGKLKLKDSSVLKQQVPQDYMKYVVPLPAGVELSSVGYYWDGASHDYTDIPDDQLQMVEGEPSKYDHKTFELTKGMHTFKIKNEFKNYRNGRVVAVLITNNPQFNELDNYSVPSYDGQPEIFKEAVDNLSDIAAPSFSGDLFAGEIVENSVTVNWNTDDNDIVCIEVSVDGDSQTVEYDGVNSYTFTGLTATTEYTFGIKLMDSLGQYAYKEITVSTTGIVDNEPPVLSGTLTVSSDTPGQINLSWEEAQDNIAVAKYVIYLDDINKKVKEVSPQTLSTSINAPRGQHTVYVCAADNAGNMSEPITAQVFVQGVTNIMLRPDNFTYNSTDKGWKKSREDRILFGDRTVLGKENSDSETANARVYLEKGVYRLMAYVLDPVASPGSRAFTVKVDGEDTDYEFVKKGIKTQSNTAQNAFYDYWDTGFIFEVGSTGMHDIEVSTSAANVKFYGILITSNDSEDTAGLTAEVVTAYEDITPPSVPSWSIKANSLNEAYIEIDGDGAAYVVTDALGNEIKTISGGSGVIENISSLKNYEYIVTAYDAHGNAAQGEKKNFYMSPVGVNWDIAKSGTVTKLNYKITGNSANNTSGILILAIYNNKGACADYVTKEYTISGSGNESGELTIENSEFNTARAMLWDNTDDMHPLALSLEYTE